MNTVVPWEMWTPVCKQWLRCMVSNSTPLKWEITLPGLLYTGGSVSP